MTESVWHLLVKTVKHHRGSVYSAQLKGYVSSRPENSLKLSSYTNLAGSETCTSWLNSSGFWGSFSFPGRRKTLHHIFKCNLQIILSHTSIKTIRIFTLIFTWLDIPKWHWKNTNYYTRSNWKSNRPISSCINLTQNLLSKASINSDLFFRQNLFPKLVIAQDNARFRTENICWNFSRHCSMHADGKSALVSVSKWNSVKVNWKFETIREKHCSRTYVNIKIRVLFSVGRSIIKLDDSQAPVNEPIRPEFLLGKDNRVQELFAARKTTCKLRS